MLFDNEDIDMIYRTRFTEFWIYDVKSIARNCFICATPISISFEGKNNLATNQKS